VGVGMRNIQIKTRLAPLLTLMLSGIIAPSVAAQISVVAHKSVPVESIAQTDLYQLFAGDKEYWDGDTPVVIVDLAQKGELRDSFYNYLGKTSSRMRSIWLKRKLTGEGELPISVESENLLVETVADTQGAIGFVSDTYAAEHEEVKVLISGIPLVKE